MIAAFTLSRSTGVTPCHQAHGTLIVDCIVPSFCTLALGMGVIADYGMSCSVAFSAVDHTPPFFRSNPAH